QPDRHPARHLSEDREGVEAGRLEALAPADSPCPFNCQGTAISRAGERSVLSFAWFGYFPLRLVFIRDGLVSPRPSRALSCPPGPGYQTHGGASAPRRNPLLNVTRTQDPDPQPDS